MPLAGTWRWRLQKTAPWHQPVPCASQDAGAFAGGNAMTSSIKKVP
jgi:hypothetical protein